MKVLRRLLEKSKFPWIVSVISISLTTLFGLNIIETPVSLFPDETYQIIFWDGTVIVVDSYDIKLDKIVCLGFWEKKGPVWVNSPLSEVVLPVNFVICLTEDGNSNCRITGHKQDCNLGISRHTFWPPKTVIWGPER